jgi:hypothetical protein
LMQRGEDAETIAAAYGHVGVTAVLQKWEPAKALRRARGSAEKAAEARRPRQL